MAEELDISFLKRFNSYNSSMQQFDDAVWTWKGRSLLKVIKN
jgi:hypothetical protein